MILGLTVSPAKVIVVAQYLRKMNQYIVSPCYGTSHVLSEVLKCNQASQSPEGFVKALAAIYLSHC